MKKSGTILIIIVLLGIAMAFFQAYKDNINKKRAAAAAALYVNTLTNGASGSTSNPLSSPYSAYNYEKNGTGFNTKIQKIMEYEEMLTDTNSVKKLKRAAEAVADINIHEAYIPIRQAVEEALLKKAKLIEEGKTENEIILWCNDKKIEIFDIMEECFIAAGIEYTRIDQLHIEYQYKIMQP